ncbi:MAG TPA: OmpH family outer membrane protein [Bacteroidales bacterium]|nr:OmpH family outer membrane protein [Bacteroidales bacterium]
MKKSITLILSLAFVSFYATSQSLYKIGHINTQELIELMPETDSAQKKIDKLYKDLQQQLELMQTELKVKYQDYINKKNTFSESVLELKETELQDLNARIQKFQTLAQDEVENKRNDLYKPILDKANAAISAVAKENSFTYIFDASGGALLYKADNSIDIMPLVKQKLKLR